MMSFPHLKTFSGDSWFANILNWTFVSSCSLSLLHVEANLSPGFPLCAYSLSFDRRACFSNVRHLLLTVG